MGSSKNTSFWRKGSVGNHMTSEVPAVPYYFSLGDVEKYLESNVNHLESIEYIYVLDKNHKILGVVSSKKLFSIPKKTRLSDIIPKTKLITVKPTDRQESAAYLSLKHDLSAIPVVDDKKVFLGVITKHKVLEILHKKHLEDFFHVAGVHRSHAQFDNIFDISIFQSIKHRIIWLLAGLFGGLLVAKIINLFEATLYQHVILAAFIPLVIYIASAVGTQLEAFSIRDFSLFRNINFHFYFIKQFSIVFIMAILLGGITTLITLPFLTSPIPSVLGIAIFVASISSIITGLLIPFIFRKLKKDPVNGSGPIGTIIQDLLSVIIYFAVAYYML